MIKDLNDNQYVLNIDKLEYDVEHRCFAKLFSIEPRKTIHGDLYFSMCFKDRFGRPIYGNMFEPYINKYINDWESFIGNIIVVIGTPREKPNGAMIDVTGMFKPSLEDSKKIQGELFEGIIDNLDNYKKQLEDFTTSDAEVDKLYHTILKSSNYKNLEFISDMQMLQGKNGVYYVVFANVLNSLRELEFLTEVEVQKMMFTLILVESLTLTLEHKNNFNFKMKVITSLDKLIKTINMKTDLYDLCIGYINLSITDNTQTTRLSEIVHKVYNNTIELYKYNEKFNRVSYGHALKIDENKTVRSN